MPEGIAFVLRLHEPRQTAENTEPTHMPSVGGGCVGLAIQAPLPTMLCTDSIQKSFHTAWVGSGP